MKKLFLLFNLLHSFQHLSLAQTPEIDSLLNVLRTAREDTHKVNTLNEISWEFGSINPDTAVYFATVALELAEKLAYKKGIAKSYQSIANSYARLGNHPDALINHYAALEIITELLEQAKNMGSTAEILNYNKGLSSSYHNIGNVHFVQGNYAKALENYFVSLKFEEELGDKNRIANTINNIGNVYYEQEDYQKALENYSASLKMQNDFGDKQGMAGSYLNLGMVYRKQGNNEEAFRNQNMALILFEELGNKRGLSYTYNNLASGYISIGNYAEALKNYTVALKIREEMDDKYGIATTYINLGVVYSNQKKYKEAEEWLGKGRELSKKIGSKILIKNSYEGLTDIDSARGQEASIRGDFKSATQYFNNALLNYKCFIAYRDSLLNEENTKQITQMEMQYEFDKKEAIAKTEQEKKDAVALKELQKQKLVRNGFVGGFAVMLLFAGVFFTQRNSIKKSKKQSDELLLNILPSEVAEELKAKGYADAQQFDQVTVLFTDFKGFTQISERLSPKDLVAAINECFKAFDEIMGKYGIEKIKTIGDAYMAAGGLPVPNTSNPESVVKAAIEMRDWMLNYREQKGEDGFEIRIGIHTGPVVAGIVGIKKFQYDIWGDTVNTASRMESSGEAGKVNISETTYELVKDQFICAYRGEVEAKGKGKLKMYFVS